MVSQLTYIDRDRVEEAMMDGSKFAGSLDTKSKVEEKKKESLKLVIEFDPKQVTRTEAKFEGPWNGLMFGAALRIIKKGWRKRKYDVLRESIKKNAQAIEQEKIDVKERAKKEAQARAQARAKKGRVGDGR